MQCDRCLRAAVIHQPYSGLHLCGHHLIMDISAKAKRTVRANGGLRPGDRIAVILTGQKSGYALLFFMHSLLADRRDITLQCIVCAHDRHQHIRAHRICTDLGIDCIDLRIQEGLPSFAGIEVSSGQIWEELLHAKRELGITKFAFDWTLDDTALRVFIKLLEGGGPAIGNEAKLQLSIILPFMRIPAREVNLYIATLYPEINEVSLSEDQFEDISPVFQEDVKILLDDYCSKHPSTKFALVNLGETLQSCGFALFMPTDFHQARTEYRGEP